MARKKYSSSRTGEEENDRSARLQEFLDSLTPPEREYLNLLTKEVADEMAARRREQYVAGQEVSRTAIVVMFGPLAMLELLVQTYAFLERREVRP